MDGIIKRFTTFDKLIATSLIKLIYWIGIVGITLMVLVGMFSGFSKGFVAGVGGLIVSPIVGIISLIFWRFICEIYIVVFGMYDRLGNIEKAVAKD